MQIGSERDRWDTKIRTIEADIRRGAASIVNLALVYQGALNASQAAFLEAKHMIAGPQ